jgi:hypothetical protein
MWSIFLSAGHAAGAVDLLPGKEAGLGFRVPPAYGAFDYEFGHITHSYSISQTQSKHFESSKQEAFLKQRLFQSWRLQFDLTLFIPHVFA